MSFASFVERHPKGAKVDTDGYPNKKDNGPYQCVDLVVLFLAEEAGLKIPGTFGNAWAWWDHPSSKILELCDRLVTKDVEAGDIVPLKPISGTDGHIVLATGNERGNEFEAYEQNGSSGKGFGKDSDALRYRWITKDRMAGVYRIKAVAAAPAPSPTAGRPRRTLVQGDTFWSLENKLGIGHGALAEWNPGLNPRALPVGTSIFVGPAESAPAPAAQPNASLVHIVINKGAWNVRTSPEIGDNVLPGSKNQVLGGQHYTATIEADDWARIVFRGADRFIGPKAYSRA